MKATLQKTWVWLLAAIAVLVLVAGAKSALAYFTTYANASGGHTITLKAQTKLEEKVENYQKLVTITNTGEVAVYVRVKAFAGFDLTYTLGDGWSQNADGYYYYNTPIEPNKTSTTLTVGIEKLSQTELEQANIIVVQEACIVKYKSDGRAYANWDETLTTTDTQ